MDRLLPYHAMATEEGDDADVDETHDGEGANLLCSRRCDGAPDEPHVCCSRGSRPFCSCDLVP